MLENFLIVEDEPLLICIYEDLIKARRSEALVFKASNGEEALNEVRKRDYSLILSDLEMPVMNGIDFYNTIKSEYPHMSEKVNFISGSNREDYFSFLADEGRSVLSKPFINEAFYHFVEKSLNLDKSQGPPVDCVDARQHKRLGYVDSALLKSVGGAMDSYAIRGFTEDYSIGGFRLRHEGDLLPEGTLMKVFLNVLGVVGREARVAWSYAMDSSVNTGLKWV